jgi:hypothetical protein
MFANGNFSSEAQTVKASEGPSYRAGRDKQKYTASAGPGPGPGPAHSAASSSANALCCALKRGPQECSGANRHRRRTRSDRAAGLDLISEEHRPVGERLNYGADKAEPDQGPKRLVLRVKLEFVTYAPVQKMNADVLEGGPSSTLSGSPSTPARIRTARWSRSRMTGSGSCFSAPVTPRSAARRSERNPFDERCWCSLKRRPAGLFRATLNQCLED